MARTVAIFGETLLSIKIQFTKVEGIVSLSRSVLGLPLPHAQQLQVSFKLVLHLTTLVSVCAVLPNCLIDFFVKK